MKEFHEPMLYLSSPEHPNTMSMVVELAEPVDGDILREVADELRTRFPYFYIRAVARDNDIHAEENPLPMTVRDTWAPIDFNAQESNYHLAAWKYEGKRMAFEVSHSLTDGSGIIPYIKSALYLYLTHTTGEALDPAGIRLPGETIPESEVGNPFADMDDDISAAEMPEQAKQTAEDFYRLRDGENADSLSLGSQVHCLKLSESQVMRCCKEHGGSPNALIAVLLARAVRRYDPESERTVSVSIAIDHKAMLGVHDNYRLFANVVEVDFPTDMPLDCLTDSCSFARGQIKSQARPENSLWALRGRKMLYAKLDQVPLETKIAAMAKASGNARWSFSNSYLNLQTMGSLDSYVEALYLVAEPGVADICIGMVCVNHSFFLAMNESFPVDRYMDAFLEELACVGIDPEVTRVEPLRLCGMEPFKA